MQHVLSLSNSCLLAKCAITLNPMILGNIYPLMFAVRNDTSPYPILMWHPNGFMNVKIGCRFGG